MKWKNGFYMDNEAPENATFITDERYAELLQGQHKGLAICDVSGTPQLRETTNMAVFQRIAELKAELAPIMEDVEQEALGIVRDDYAEKKARAAEIINELRVLEGKEPRTVGTIL